MSLSTSALPAPQTGQSMPFIHGAANAFDYAGPQRASASAHARIVRSSSTRKLLTERQAEQSKGSQNGQGADANDWQVRRTIFQARTVKDKSEGQRPAIILEHY